MNIIKPTYFARHAISVCKWFYYFWAIKLTTKDQEQHLSRNFKRCAFIIKNFFPNDQSSNVYINQSLKKDDIILIQKYPRFMYLQKTWFHLLNKIFICIHIIYITHITIPICEQIFRKNIQETINIAYLSGIQKESFLLITFYTLLNYLAFP